MAKAKSEFLMYKGKPFVRSGNTLYYGDMNDKFVVMLQIQDKEMVADLEVATKVTVQLISTDPDVRPRDRLVKRSEKNGLYEAIEIGAIWLERALAAE